MEKILRITLLILLLILLVACAGRNFVRPSNDIIQLGKTTEQKVIAELGKPYSSERYEADGNWVYLFYGIVSDFGMKHAKFYFKDDLLVGYVFSSSFPEDSTDFDLTNADKIIENQSTRQDVETYFGKPTGEYIFPMADFPEGRTLIYLCRGRYRGESVIKEITVETDKEGIVKNFDVKFGVIED